MGLMPQLTPTQVKALIIQNADKDLLEKGINIINPAKTVSVMRKMYSISLKIIINLKEQGKKSEYSVLYFICSFVVIFSVSL